MLESTVRPNHLHRLVGLGRCAVKLDLTAGQKLLQYTAKRILTGDRDSAQLQMYNYYCTNKYRLIGLKFAPSSPICILCQMIVMLPF